MERNLVKVSKFLSLVLRHRPETIDLKLDAQGWAEIDQLLDCMQRSNQEIDRPTLEMVVAENDKQRFTISADGKRIRANQGHSLKSVELKLHPLEPPDELYHGTVSQFIESIRDHGLKKQNRHHVHLSSDQETARRVALRRGRPVILRVKSKAMYADGLAFFLSANGVWLTESVPTKYLEFPKQ